MMKALFIVLAMLLLNNAHAAGPLFKHSDTQGPQEKTGYGKLFKKHTDAPGVAKTNADTAEGVPAAEPGEPTFTPGTPASNSIAPDENSAGKAAAQREFENVYHDISFPKISTGTAQNFTIVNATITRLSVSSLNVSSITASYSSISSATIVDLTYTNIHPTPTGKFKQVVSSETSTSFSTTSTSYQKTPLGLTITPSATTSKILCWATFPCLTSRIDQDFCFATLERDGNNLGTTNGFAYLTSNTILTVNFQATYPIVYLDSPNTTSATVYQIYIKTSAGAATATFNNNAANASMVCAEIGA